MEVVEAAAAAATAVSDNEAAAAAAAARGLSVAVAAAATAAAAGVRTAACKEPLLLPPRMDADPAIDPELETLPEAPRLRSAEDGRAGTAPQADDDDEAAVPDPGRVRPALRGLSASLVLGAAVPVEPAVPDDDPLLPGRVRPALEGCAASPAPPAAPWDAAAPAVADDDPLGRVRPALDGRAEAEAEGAAAPPEADAEVPEEGRVRPALVGRPAPWEASMETEKGEAAAATSALTGRVLPALLGRSAPEEEEEAPMAALALTGRVRPALAGRSAAAPGPVPAPALLGRVRPALVGRANAAEPMPLLLPRGVEGCCRAEDETKDRDTPSDDRPDIDVRGVTPPPPLVPSPVADTEPPRPASPPLLLLRRSVRAPSPVPPSDARVPCLPLPPPSRASLGACRAPLSRTEPLVLSRREEDDAEADVDARSKRWSWSAAADCCCCCCTSLDLLLPLMLCRSAASLPVGDGGVAPTAPLPPLCSRSNAGPNPAPLLHADPTPPLPPPPALPVPAAAAALGLLVASGPSRMLWCARVKLMSRVRTGPGVPALPRAAPPPLALPLPLPVFPDVRGLRDTDAPEPPPPAEAPAAAAPPLLLVGRICPGEAGRDRLPPDDETPAVMPAPLPLAPVRLERTPALPEVAGAEPDPATAAAAAAMRLAASVEVRLRPRLLLCCCCCCPALAAAWVPDPDPGPDRLDEPRGVRPPFWIEKDLEPELVSRLDVAEAEAGRVPDEPTGVPSRLLRWPLAEAAAPVAAIGAEMGLREELLTVLAAATGPPLDTPAWREEEDCRMEDKPGGRAHRPCTVAVTGVNNAGKDARRASQQLNLACQ